MHTQSKNPQRLVATALTLTLGACGAASAERVDGTQVSMIAGNVAAGQRHSCSVSEVGAVRCSGDNAAGQLGNGRSEGRGKSVAVVGLDAGVVAVGIGDYHTCALSAGGAVKCWGLNNFGQLGDGSGRFQASVPVAVVGLQSGVIGLAVGKRHNCALLSGGTVKCWGSNSAGQLGGDATDRSAVPIAVKGLGAAATEIRVARSQSCAALSGGSFKCWGDSDNGSTPGLNIARGNR